jgi:homoserine dehydrogenase
MSLTRFLCEETSWNTFWAGGHATASAVLSDLADAALDCVGTKHRVPHSFPARARWFPSTKLFRRYFARLDVVDVPGTLAKIAKIFGDAKIGSHPDST